MATAALAQDNLDNYPDYMVKSDNPLPEQRLYNLYPDASIIREYRINLPLSVEEYRIAQLYSVAEASKNETGGGDGLEIIANEPFDYTQSTIPTESPLKGKKGQYTFKRIYLKNKVPGILASLAPKGSLEMYEEAWNAYPFCRTVYTNGYMKDSFYICLDTWHKPGTWTIDNVHKLDEKILKKRTIDKIDIVNDPFKGAKDGEDPKTYVSAKAGRGPFLDQDGKNWADVLVASESTVDATEEDKHVMCAYKMYYVKFKWRGLQNRMESMIMSNVRRVLQSFHRQVVCWMDKWYGMTIESIREMESKTKDDLVKMRQEGTAKGSKMSE